MAQPVSLPPARTAALAAWRERLHRRVAYLAATPAIPVAVAIGLGLFRIGDKSIWLDEAVSVAIARLPTIDMLLYLWRSELHAAPYYIVLHPWLSLGQSEFVVRALSVPFGMVAVLATWAIGRRYGVAFPAALLLAVSPAFIQYEQEARGYTMLIAASAVSTLLLLRLIERPARWRAVGYVLAAAAMIYVHPLGALVVVAHGLAVLAFAPAGMRWRLLALFVPVIVGWLPMIRFMLANRERIAWIPPTTIEGALHEFTSLTGGLALAALLVPLLLLGLRRDPITPWLLVPLLGTLLLSLLVQPLLVARYLVGVLPAAAVVAARNRPLFVGALIVLSLVATASWYEHGEKEDWRSAAAWVAAEVQPGDGIVFAPAFLRSPFGYYARVARPLYPSTPWSESDLRRQPADLAAVRASPRVWLVEGRNFALPPDLRSALDGMAHLETRHFGPRDVRVTLLTRAAGSAP